MIDIMVGLLVVVMVGAALGYIRKEKKKGAVCIGCPNAGACGKSHCGCHNHE